jgi:hypothetical protein
MAGFIATKLAGLLYRLLPVAVPKLVVVEGALAFAVVVVA